LDSLKIRFKIVRSQTGNASFSFFGATLTVTYSLPASGYYYTYTLSNVQAAHTILLASAGPSTDVIYYKNNGSWVAATAVYKKVNGSWVLQSNLANVFSASVNYVKGN
jgi:phosphoglycerol transferase MdoB-like AlkP superfamily enzyme